MTDSFSSVVANAQSTTWESTWSKQTSFKYMPAFIKNTYTKNYGGAQRGIVTITSS